MKKISPLAPEHFPILPFIDGVKLGAINCGMRYRKRYDLMLAEFARGTQVAGVFTKSSITGAPVDWCKSILKNGQARALVVNSGIANVFMGARGKASVAKTVKTVCGLLKCSAGEVYVSSTGIIGQPIKDHLLCAALPKLYKNLKPSLWHSVAKAILTTDTFPKATTRTAEIAGVPVRINGIAKGSGMIQPNMATMLAYVFTDAAIPAEILQKLLDKAVIPSFNSITVDSDTSTSDTLLVFATGREKHKAVISEKDLHLKDFKEKFLEVLTELAQLVVKDGEGAQKFITINVEGAVSENSARKIGLVIANSPLVKTALAAGDANWGRIVMAVGKSGEKAVRDKLSVWIGNVLVAKNGAINPEYHEAATARYMAGREIEITVDIGIGKGKATIWTCDLTHEYVSINADYRT